MFNGLLEPGMILTSLSSRRHQLTLRALKLPKVCLRLLLIIIALVLLTGGTAPSQESPDKPATQNGKAQVYIYRTPNESLYSGLVYVNGDFLARWMYGRIFHVKGDLLISRNEPDVGLYISREFPPGKITITATKDIQCVAEPNRVCGCKGIDWQSLSQARAQDVAQCKSDLMGIASAIRELREHKEVRYPSPLQRCDTSTGRDDRTHGEPAQVWTPYDLDTCSSEISDALATLDGSNIHGRVDMELEAGKSNYLRLSAAREGIKLVDAKTGTKEIGRLQRIYPKLKAL